MNPSPSLRGAIEAWIAATPLSSPPYLGACVRSQRALDTVARKPLAFADERYVPARLSFVLVDTPGSLELRAAAAMLGSVAGGLSAGDANVRLATFAGAGVGVLASVAYHNIRERAVLRNRGVHGIAYATPELPVEADVLQKRVAAASAREPHEAHAEGLLAYLQYVNERHPGDADRVAFANRIAYVAMRAAHDAVLHPRSRPSADVAFARLLLSQ